jgi:hypothetical protein
MILNDAELAVLSGDVINLAAFFRLETDPVVRLWLGFGDIVASASLLDPDGAEYTGFGEISNLPEFSQMINGAAERVDFTISGVSGPILEVAAGDATNVQGKRVSIGFGIFDSSWQLLGAPKWFAHYRADVLSIGQQPTGDPESPIIRSITLSCGSLMTMRRRPARSYFSNVDQQARFPGDEFCSLTQKYAHGFSKPWPKLPSS